MSWITAIHNVHAPDVPKVSYTHTYIHTQLHKVLSAFPPLPLLPGSNQLSQHDVILLTLPHIVCWLFYAGVREVRSGNAKQ